jgi:hypothetical protein
MLDPNRALSAVASAMVALADSRRAALPATSVVREVLRDAERDQFTEWYDCDRLFGLDRLSQRLHRAIADLRKP